MRRMKINTRRGVSYAKRVMDVNDIYDKYARSGLSNREIWRRYVWPLTGVCERTFYNLLKASTNPYLDSIEGDRQLLLSFTFD